MSKLSHEKKTKKTSRCLFFLLELVLSSVRDSGQHKRCFSVDPCLLRLFLLFLLHCFYFDFLCAFSSCRDISLEDVLIAWQAKIVDNRANSCSNHTASSTDAKHHSMGTIWFFFSFSTDMVRRIQYLYFISNIVWYYTVCLNLQIRQDTRTTLHNIQKEVNDNHLNKSLRNCIDIALTHRCIRTFLTIL